MFGSSSFRRSRDPIKTNGSDLHHVTVSRVLSKIFKKIFASLNIYALTPALTAQQAELTLCCARELGATQLLDPSQRYRLSKRILRLAMEVIPRVHAGAVIFLIGLMRSPLPPPFYLRA